MGGWEEKSASARESLFDAAVDPGRKLLTVPAIFFSPSFGSFHLNCVVLVYFSVQPRFHRERKGEAELRIGNLINPVCTEYMLFQKVCWSLVWHCTGQLKMVVPIIIFCNRKA